MWPAPGGPPNATGVVAFEPVPHRIGPATTVAFATGRPAASTTRPEMLRPRSTVIVPASVVLPALISSGGSARSVKPGPRIAMRYERGGTFGISNEPSLLEIGTAVPQPPRLTVNAAACRPSAN